MSSRSRTEAISITALSLVVAILTAAGARPALAQEGATATGISRLMNPAISVNGLFLVSSDTIAEPGGEAGAAPQEAAGDEDHGETAPGGGAVRRGFNLQEAEVQFTASIDPFSRADLVLAIPGAEGLEIEEANLQLTSLPAGLGLRFGKLFADLGRQNRLHAHQFPFIDAPLGHRVLLGEEGVNEVGMELSYLVPLPWFSDLIGGVYQGDHERFASEDPDAFAYLLRCRNLWDLDESTTLDLGASGMVGENRSRHHTWIGGVDLTLRWEPIRSTAYRQLIWQSEWLGVDEGRSPEAGAVGAPAAARGADAKPWGAHSQLQYRFARTWWAQLRYDHFEPPAGAGEEFPGVLNRWSVLLAKVPSEFSALRLQYSLVREPTRTDHQFFLQFNFTIGSHPAHRY